LRLCGDWGNSREKKKKMNEGKGEKSQSARGEKGKVIRLQIRCRDIRRKKKRDDGHGWQENREPVARQKRGEKEKENYPCPIKGREGEEATIKTLTASKEFGKRKSARPEGRREIDGENCPRVAGRKSPSVFPWFRETRGKSRRPLKKEKRRKKNPVQETGKWKSHWGGFVKRGV